MYFPSLRQNMSLRAETFDTVLSQQIKDFLGLYFDEPGRLDLILSSLARPPRYTTIRVNTLKTTASELVSNINGHLTGTIHSAQRHEVRDFIPFNYFRVSL